MRGSPALPLLLALALCACGDDPTEIVLVVDGDVGGLTQVRIDAMRPSDMGIMRVMTAAPLPQTVVLRHRGGALGPVTATVQAFDGAPAAAVTRTLSMWFEEGETLRYEVFLSNDCRMVACGAGLTCAGGVCRSEEVRPCEFEGRSCPLDTDAGGPPGDGGLRDGDPVDGSRTCPLAAGLCDVGGDRAPGDAVAPQSCTPPGGVSLAWSASDPGGMPLSPETGSTSAAPVFRLGPAPGTYTIRAVAPDLAGCEAEATIEVVAFIAAADGTSAPGVSSDDRRDMDARVGRAFFATRVGPYTVAMAGGWARLNGTSGAVVADDLRSVAVWYDRVYFGPDGDQDAISETEVSDDLSTVVYTDLPLLPDADRSVQAMDAPGDGATGPLVVATRTGLFSVDDRAGTRTATAQGPTYDADVDVAVGTRESPGRAALWALKVNEILNVSTSGVGAFNGGAGTDTDPWAALRGIEVDDAENARRRLWLCDEDAGVAVFDLSTDWSGLSALPAPIRMAGATCRDIDIDEAGDAWVTTGTSVVRYRPDGSQVLELTDAAHGVGRAPLNVAVAWDGTTRVVWILDDSGEVRRIASDLP